MTIHSMLPVLPVHSRAHGWHRLLTALAVVLLALAGVTTRNDASAKAPPLATTVFDTEALAAPEYGAAPVTVIPRGAELELTGAAAPGFLAVYYDGQAVWVPAQYLSLGVRAGVDTAVAIEDTPLLDAPMREATIVETVLEGQTVILTGASVDGYDAASHEGAGGWILERALSR